MTSGGSARPLMRNYGAVGQVWTSRMLEISKRDSAEPPSSPRRRTLGQKPPRVRGGNPVRALLTRGRTPVRPQAASPPSGGASEHAGSEGPKRAYPGPWPEPGAPPTAECRAAAQRSRSRRAPALSVPAASHGARGAAHGASSWKDAGSHCGAPSRERPRGGTWGAEPALLSRAEDRHRVRVQARGAVGLPRGHLWGEPNVRES